MIKSVVWTRDPFHAVIEGKRDADGSLFAYDAYHPISVMQDLIAEMQKRNKPDLVDDSWLKAQMIEEAKQLLGADAPAIMQPRPILSGLEFACILVKAGLLDSLAIEDPEGYDGGKTQNTVYRLAEELGFSLQKRGN